MRRQDKVPLAFGSTPKPPKPLHRSPMAWLIATLIAAVVAAVLLTGCSPSSGVRIIEDYDPVGLQRTRRDINAYNRWSESEKSFRATEKNGVYDITFSDRSDSTQFFEDASKMLGLGLSLLALVEGRNVLPSSGTSASSDGITLEQPNENTANMVARIAEIEAAGEQKDREIERLKAELAAAQRED